jgi:hypothetical protein
MTTATTPPASSSSSSTVAQMSTRGVLAGYPDLVALAAKGNLIYHQCLALTSVVLPSLLLPAETAERVELLNFHSYCSVVFSYVFLCKS